MKLRALVLAALVVAAAAACDSGAPQAQASPADLSGLLTSAVPPGYVTPASGAASMDIAAAAPSTLVDPAAMRGFLVQNEYRAGYVHIYTSGSSYIDLLVFQFAEAPESDAMVKFEVQQLKGTLGADVQPEPAIAGSYVFTLFARTKATPRPVFCEGTWYALGDYAFGVLTCGSAPGDTSLALDLTSLQYAQDLQALHMSPPVTPTP